MKTAKLQDAALDWAVAKALGHALKIRTWKAITDTLDPTEDADIIAFHKERNTVRVSAEQIPGGGWFPNPRYSTDWAFGGPIIERGKMDFSWIGADKCRAAIDWLDEEFYEAFGPTPLIAAMRCYVASKLGDEVEVPEVLV